MNYREVGLLLQEAGCGWVTMHGRTRSQKFRGAAHWDHIADLVDTLEIPVIGNGDVVDGASYAAMLERTRCHAVMVGRGAIGNPWLFSEAAAVDAGTEFRPPTLLEIMDVLHKHIDLIAKVRGERHAPSWCASTWCAISALSRSRGHAAAPLRQRERRGDARGAGRTATRSGGDVLKIRTRLRLLGAVCAIVLAAGCASRTGGRVNASPR